MSNETDRRWAEPEWLIFGLAHPHGGGVSVFATGALRDAKVQVDTEMVEAKPGDPGYDDHWRSFRPGARTTTVNAAADGDLVRGHGATYAEALADLVTRWDPARGPAPAEIGG